MRFWRLCRKPRYRGSLQGRQKPYTRNSHRSRVRSILPTYVIERSFSFTLIIIVDMKRTTSNNAFKSKKPYDRRSMHGPGTSTSTSRSTSNTDLMPHIPACDLDATSSAQPEITAGGSVSLPFPSLSVDSLLSNRPPINSKSLPRFPLWRSVTFLL